MKKYKEILEKIYFSHPVRTLSLTLPPSVNSCYSNVAGKGRVKTKAYRQWIKFCDNLLSVTKQNIEPLKGKYIVLYELDKPDRRKRDCANYEKALSDYLVSRNILQDDSNIEFNAQLWSGEKGDDVTCYIYPAN